MKNLFLLFIALLLLQKISYAQIPGSFEFEGRTRIYEVFLPQNFQPNMPVVFTLHGYTESISSMKSMSKMHEAADTTGFVTVYPQSASISWNTGETKPPWWPMYDTTVNDVGFFSALIDIIYGQYEIDLDSVYVCGHSSGGEMAFRLAIELGHRFAAVASINGPLNEVLGSLDPLRPFPIMHKHGTADPFIDYYDPHYNQWSVEETLNFWVENNGCSLPADTIPLSDDIYKISYNNCTDDNKVVHYKFIGGGHDWPHSPINTSVEILNFFMNYENPSVKFACVRTVEIFPRYIDPIGDTLFIQAHMTNLENHSASVYAKFLGDGVSFSDSLKLYDDGLHYDKDPDDNIFGNAIWLSGLEEELYKVDFYTHDFNAGTIHKYHKSNYFTTIGPVVIDTFRIIDRDENYFTLEYDLRNDGSTATAPAVTAVATTTDTNVTNEQGTLVFGNIEPGQVKGHSFFLRYYTQNNPSSIDFTVSIFSNSHFFWTDSFTVPLITGITENETNLPMEYALRQNYPNPFNPKTTIKYEIPELSFVTLKVYDVLGNEIETLVNKEQPAGQYEIEFNSSSLSSGVYFYKLETENFGETKKMVLLR